MPDTVYVLDANVPIEASQRYYAFDIAPGFWEMLVRRAEDGRVVSIDRVRDELERGDDELWRWAKRHFTPWFVPTHDGATPECYRQVVNWVQAQDRFSAPAKDAFYAGADGWLVAWALNRGHVVVTQEVSRPGSRSSVKIPDVCEAFNVAYVDTFQMLRQLDVRWTSSQS